MLMEVPAGMAMLVATLLLHGFGLRLITIRFNRGWSRVTLRTPRWRIDVMLAFVIGLLAALHMLEMLIFAVPLYWLGAMDELSNSYFFVMESYTTLGSGDLRPQEHWRMVGPIIAMAGVFSVGWTVSVLVSIMGQINSIDRAQAAAAAKEKAAASAQGQPHAGGVSSARPAPSTTPAEAQTPPRAGG